MTRRIVPASPLRQAVCAAAFAILLASLAAIVGIPNPAGAEDEISITPSSSISGEPGSIRTVATSDVPTEFVGSSCKLSVVAENGSSTHIGNTLIVITGDSRVEIPGIEDTPDGSVVAELDVVLGSAIELQVHLGDEGLSSLGFTAGFDCPEEAPEVLPAQQLPEPEEPEQPEQLPQTPTADATHAQPTFTG